MFSPDGGAAQFVWCEITGYEQGNPRFSCSGAGGCRCAPCAASDWTSIGETILPRSFVEDRRCADGVEKPQPGAVRLVPSDPQQVVSFGKVIAATEDRIVATVRDADQVPGVEVFERVGATWRGSATLVAPDPSDRDFGLTLAVGGDVVVVGSEKRVYVFERSGQGWRESARGSARSAKARTTPTSWPSPATARPWRSRRPIPSTARCCSSAPARAGSRWRRCARTPSPTRPGRSRSQPAPWWSARPRPTTAAPLASTRSGAASGSRPARSEDPRVRGSSASARRWRSRVRPSSSEPSPVGFADQRRHDGAAFVFERRDDGAWQEVARLETCAPDLGRFAAVLAVSGGRALVAAPSFDGGGAAGRRVRLRALGCGLAREGQARGLRCGPDRQRGGRLRRAGR